MCLQLAAGIAHDFNNIMSVISIYAEEEQASWQELGVEVLLMKTPHSRQLAEAMAQVLRRPSSSL